jgi:monoamine oxidase
MAGRKAKGVDATLLAGKGLTTLATVLGGEVESHLVSRHTHDWQADARSMGAYTYVPAGAIQASEWMSEPVEQTLFFAGEHTDTSGHWGTVHGALRSGYRAARQLLSQD